MRLTSIFCAYSTSRINFNLLSYAWRNGVKTQNIPSPHWKKLVSWPLTPRLRDLSSASIGMVHIVRTRQSLGTGETINVSNVGPCTAFPERAVYLTRLSLQLVAAWLRAATHCSLSLAVSTISCSDAVTPALKFCSRLASRWNLWMMMMLPLPPLQIATILSPS